MINARALPDSATFSQVTGCWCGQEWSGPKRWRPVAVQAQPDHAVVAVLQPSVSSAVLGPGTTAVAHPGHPGRRG